MDCTSESIKSHELTRVGDFVCRSRSFDVTRVCVVCSGSGALSKNISGWYLKRSPGGLPALDANGVEVKGRASLNAGVNK